MFELAFISPPDIMVVMVVALLVFGPNRLPEVGKQVGQFLREGRKMMSSFTDAMNDVHDDVRTPFTDQTVRGEMVKDQEPELVAETKVETGKESESPKPVVSEHSDSEHSNNGSDAASVHDLKSESKD